MNIEPILKPESNAHAGTAVALLADAAGVGLFLLFFSPLANQFGEIRSINAAVLGSVFVLFCISVYLLKKLEATPAPAAAVHVPDWLLTARSLRMAGFLFGVWIAAGLAHQLGYFDLMLAVDDRVLGAGESSAFFVYAPGSWLGGALIYALILSSTAPPRFQLSQPRYRWIAFAGLLGVNGMLLVTAVALNALIYTLAPVWVGLVGLALLLLLFAPVRLIYFQRQPSVTVLISHLILLLVAAGMLIIGG